MIRLKMVEYVDRAEKLKAHISQSDEKRARQAVNANGKSSGGGGGSGKSKGGDDDDVDAETKKLRQGLASESQPVVDLFALLVIPDWGQVPFYPRLQT